MVASLYRQYQEQLALNHALDFDDLLIGVVDLLKGAPDVLARYQERYQYLLVDEFQDTNVAQYEIVRLLGAKHHNVCAVGDVDQAIYSWRAADPRNVFHFQRDFPEHKVVLLEQNYRSTQAILDVADAVIRLAPGRHEKRLWTELERWAARQGISLWDALQRVAHDKDAGPGVPPCPLATRARRACTMFVELIEELQAEREGLTVLELLDLLLDRSGYARHLKEEE